MKKTALVAIALALTCAGGVSVGSQGKGQFHFNGKVWANQADFIKAGLRCGTRQIDPGPDDQSSAAPGRGQPGPGGDVPVINVYFHIIRSSSGAGAVSDRQIDDQIDILNDAYFGSFAFVNAGKDETVNDAWFAVEPGTPTEDAMKSA